MIKPKFPLSRMINDNSGRICNRCGSSIKIKYDFILFIIYENGCIQPECENYYNSKFLKNLKNL